MTDAVPTPPDNTEQGLPERPFPFVPTAAVIQFVRCNPIDGQDPLIALVYDSGDTRTVTYWTEKALKQMLDTGRQVLRAGTPRLTVADMNDLKALDTITPFEQPPGSLQ